LLECRFHIDGIPQHNGIDDQAQRPELIFLAFTIPLAEFAALTVKDSACHAVAAFTTVELGEDTPTIVERVKKRGD
jgi:hypothetical protein